MKKNNVVSALIGLVLGCVISYFYLSNKSEGKEQTYFELTEDVYISEVGNLKKGTILKYDDSYPEGFTRFVLYLNAKGIDLKKQKKANDNEIIPYWLEKK